MDFDSVMKQTEEALKNGEDYIRDNPNEVMWLLRDLRYEAYTMWQKYDEEVQYREWVRKNKIKGYACGYLTRQAGSQVIARRTAAQYEKEKIELRKLVNNPILSDAAKETLRRALWMIDLGLWEYNQLARIRDKENARIREKENAGD